MKNKHYEMIVAKAANMDLVVFIHHKSTTGDWCIRTEQDSTSFYDDEDYFLCLPQHKEACLHWLNGGDIESNETKSWVEVDSLELCTSHWYEGHFFMHEHEEFRIKPEKEQRWILECNGALLTTRIFTSESSAKLWIEEFDRTDEGVSVIEIEVEV